MTDLCCGSAAEIRLSSGERGLYGLHGLALRAFAGGSLQGRCVVGLRG